MNRGHSCDFTSSFTHKLIPPVFCIMSWAVTSTISMNCYPFSSLSSKSLLNVEHNFSLQCLLGVILAGKKHVGCKHRQCNIKRELQETIKATFGGLGSKLDSPLSDSLHDFSCITKSLSYLFPESQSLWSLCCSTETGEWTFDKSFILYGAAKSDWSWHSVWV